MVVMLSARSVGPYASLIAISPSPMADVVPRVPRFLVSMATACVADNTSTRDPLNQGPGIPGTAAAAGRR
jgi:hypothetical protein